LHIFFSVEVVSSFLFYSSLLCLRSQTQYPFVSDTVGCLFFLFAATLGLYKRQDHCVFADLFAYVVLLSWILVLAKKNSFGRRPLAVTCI
jgi:hypothetical protein